ncbi:MAG: four helix bundle protein [Thermomicrobiales bacterium]
MDTVKDQGYRGLLAWQRGMTLVKAVYVASKDWPPDERFGLTNQVRRAVVGIPSNIAEGKGRTGTRELLHHLSIAHGSRCEVETQLMIARDLDYMSDQRLQPLLEQAAEVGRLIRGLIQKYR